MDPNPLVLIKTFGKVQRVLGRSNPPVGCTPGSDSNEPDLLLLYFLSLLNYHNISTSTPLINHQVRRRPLLRLYWVIQLNFKIK